MECSIESFDEHNVVQQIDRSEENEGGQSVKNGKKKRSTFWKHFIEIVDDSGTRFAKCKYCVNKET